jgi:hypothetical protein
MSTIWISDAPEPAATDLNRPSAALRREFVGYVDSKLDEKEVPMLPHLKGDVTNRYSRYASVRSQSV